ncbi:MAG: hypothetical protein AAGC63_08280 [Propionicimonas sp.]|nr:hypothetical protein [Propionicimonas sp.]
MTGGRLRSVGGSLLLTLFGVLSVAATSPRMALSSTLPACITESSGTAWLGLHLSLLSQSSACPEGMFAPGAQYSEIARFTVMLSISALIAGVVALLGALGCGVWARVAVRRARAWLNHKLGLPVVTTTAAPVSRPPLLAAVERFHGALWVSLQPLRGPPVRVPA